MQEIDSVEYGLTDIQEYYANTGALKKAAETAHAAGAGDDSSASPASEQDPPRPPRRVGVSVVEAYGKSVEPRELEATLRIEYRSKLLNPKWAEAMSNQVCYLREGDIITTIPPHPPLQSKKEQKQIIYLVSSCLVSSCRVYSSLVAFRLRDGDRSTGKRGGVRDISAHDGADWLVRNGRVHGRVGLRRSGREVS